MLSVLLYHLGQAELTCWPDTFHFLYPFSLIGHIGVDLFFVISGFVMVIANLNSFGKPKELGKFLFRRAARIYPLFWLICLPQLLWLVFHDKVDIESLCGGLLLIPPQTWKISHVAWTLSYEIYFYMLFAVALLFNYRWLPLFLLAWAGLIVVGDHSSYMKNLPDHINTFWEVINITFIFGAFAAICSVKKLYAPLRPTLFATTGLILLAALFKHHGIVDFDSNFHPRLLLLGLPSALLLAASVTAEKQLGLLLPKWLEKLGDASYSIYLTHLLFIHNTKFLAIQVSNYGLRVVWIVAMFIACLTIGLLVHHLLEKPILDFIHRLSSKTNHNKAGALELQPVQAPMVPV